MSFPVARLVAARLRRRGASTSLLVVAIGAAVALVTIVGGIALVAADATVARALSTTGVDRPVIAASRFEPSAAGFRGGNTFRDYDAEVRSAFEVVDAYAGKPVSGVLFSPLFTADRALQLLAIDDPAAWTMLLDGRLPEPCDGTRCEALLLSEQPREPLTTTAVPIDGLTVDIVGRGLLVDAVPFGTLDQRGQAPGVTETDQTVQGSGPELILLRGVASVATEASPLAEVMRTYFWTAPVDPTSIHPWTAERFAADVGLLGQRTADDSGGFTILSPASTVGVELARADAARGRLLLLGSLGVAILLAFAVFAAMVNRPDVVAEHRRLLALGAGRRQRATFLVLEAAVPSILGGILGWAVVSIVVALLAVSRGADPAAVVSGALLSPAAIVVDLAVVGAAIVAIAVGSAPSRRGGGIVRLAGTAALTAAGILGWQLVGSGALDPDALGSSLASPILVLLPPVAAFLVALAFLLLVPPLLRRLARSARRAPLPLRLSLLSVAREPDRPAATLTLLAFSLGAIVFALGYSSTLDRGIAEQAAYQAGADLRVVELGTGLSISQSVVPVDRYETLGPGVERWPVVRTTGTVAPVGRIDVLGVPADALRDLDGWRPDFSADPPATLADRLALPGDWTMVGQALPPDAPTLELTMRYEGEPTRLDAIVRTTGGDFARVTFGNVDEGTTKLSTRLPTPARGGTLVALIFGNDRIVAGSGHQHPVRNATVTFPEIPGLVPAEPIDIEVFTTTSPIVRAPQATDGLRLPVVVSPDIAAAAAADGTLDLNLATGADLRLRVVGVATQLPTVLADRPSFVLVDAEPFLLAWNAALPGAGRPSEMWLGLDDPGREAEVVQALGRDPFRYPAITSRTALVAAHAADPLAEAIVGALLVAAIAGLVLALGGLLLGALSDLRDEAGELADLEAQGLAPSMLRRQILARTAWLAGGGVLAGVLVGVVLTQVATSSLALTAGGGLPIPPLRPAVPLGPVILVVVGVLAFALIAVAILGAAAYGGATLGERRNRSASTAAAATVRPEGEPRG